MDLRGSAILQGIVKAFKSRFGHHEKKEVQLCGDGCKPGLLQSFHNVHE